VREFSNYTCEWMTNLCNKICGEVRGLQYNNPLMRVIGGRAQGIREVAFVCCVLQ